MFKVINTRTEALIGSCILQENPTERGQQYEVGGMMIYPEARHIGLSALVNLETLDQFLAEQSDDTNKQKIAN